MFLLVPFILAQAARAEETASINGEDLLFMELPSVTIASKKEQKVSEAPGVISVISRDQINKFGWTSLNDVLYSQPGFSPSQDYDRRTVSSRGVFEGWNNNHLLLLMDGVPFNDDLYGTAYTWEITPLFILARSVEVLRGPGSALYGSNAMNGVINIKTLSAADLEGTSCFQVSVGDYNKQSVSAVTGRTGEKVSTVIGVNTNKTGGNNYMSYDGSGRTDSGGQPLRFKTMDDRSNDYEFVKLTGEGSLAGLSLQFHNQDWQFQTGHGWIWYIPDFAEDMKESRQLLSLSYAPPSDTSLSQEYVVRYQNHSINWNQRYYPNGTPGYPAGLWEYLDTNAEDLFVRAQASYDMGGKAHFVAGLEGSVFYYGGDSSHFSNVLLDSTFLPTAGNSMVNIKSWLEYIQDDPVINVAPYAQAIMNDLFTKDLTATLGVRYDQESFDYNNIALAGSPKTAKSFSQTNPRIGLVYAASDSLTFKALGAKAFRAPSPTEMFGANTYSLGSNIANLSPEIITTYELASNLAVNKNLSWEINCFSDKFEDQIAYSGANVSMNIYTLSTIGAETQLDYSWDRFSGFVNYSLSKRTDEVILDPTVSPNNDITWVPSQTANAGINCALGKLNTALVAHYQGEVLRRASDTLSAVNQALRPDDIDPWVSLDLNAVYKLSKTMDIGLKITDLLNNSEVLMKNRDFPFDYTLEARRISVNLTVKL